MKPSALKFSGIKLVTLKLKFSGYYKQVTTKKLTITYQVASHAFAAG